MRTKSANVLAPSFGSTTSTLGEVATNVTGASSRTGSYERFLLSSGAVTSGPWIVNRKV